MIEFEYRPIKKIVISQMMESPLEIFIQHTVTPQTPSIIWCDGMLFQHFRDDVIDKIVLDRINEGILYWSFLEYCYCEKKPVKLERKDFKCEVPVVEGSHNPIFKDLVEWIKTKDQLKEILSEVGPTISKSYKNV